MTYTWDIVIRLRPAMFVAIAAVLLLSLPSQILELYLIDIETIGETIAARGDGSASVLQTVQAIRPVLLGMLAGLGSMIVLWLSSVHLVLLDPARPNWSRLQVVTANVLIALIALAPIIGVLGGLANILSQFDQIAPQGDVEAKAALKWAVLAYITASIGLLVLTVAVLALATAIWPHRIAAQVNRIYSRNGALAGLVLVVAMTTILTIWPAKAPQAVGTQFLVYCFFAALTFVLTWFSTLYRTTGYPVTMMVIAAAMLFSGLGLNDNRQIDFTVTARPPPVEERFVNWLHARKDLGYYAERNKPYPVYVIAAEGGGMYAGYHVASLLAHLQDRCPNFAQHVFGISSVSGGSLGAAVFASLAGRSARNETWQDCRLTTNGPFQKAVQDYFSNDFLSPLVGATLFPSTLQSIIPFPFKALDRANAIEHAFAEAWVEPQAPPSAPLGDNPFHRSIHEMWSPTGAEPALFLNTTGVTSGGRVTLGPIYFRSTPTAVHISDNLCTRVPKGITLPLVTAVSLSARFPWLAPAGWLDISKVHEGHCDEGREARQRAIASSTKRIYLADGGYFENSGLETVADLVKRLRAYVEKDTSLPPRVEIRIIMATAFDSVAQRFWSDYPDMTESGPGELMTPITVLLNTRVARTRAVQAREGAFDSSMNRLAASEGAGRRSGPSPSSAGRRSGTSDGCDRLSVATDIHMVELDGTRFFLPLGWRLSRLSMVHIDSHLRDCRRKEVDKIIAELTDKESQ